MKKGRYHKGELFDQGFQLLIADGFRVSPYDNVRVCSELTKMTVGKILD